jgi:hypothetical protein
VTVHLPGLPALARRIGGVLIGGVVTAIVFLICVEGSFHEGFTDFDFAHVLGTAIEGTATEETQSEALGVIGDSAGPTALWATVVAGIVMLAVHALVVVPLVRRRWELQGLALAVVMFLAIGLIYVPYVDSRLDTPIGPWGSDQGGWTPFVFAGASVISSLIGARCYDLARSAGWWRPEGVVVDQQLTELTGIEQSLELPEEGREERAMRP